MCTPRTTAKGLLHVCPTRVGAYSKIAIKTDLHLSACRSRIPELPIRDPLHPGKECDQVPVFVSESRCVRRCRRTVSLRPFVPIFLFISFREVATKRLEQTSLLKRLAALAAEGLELLPGRPIGRALTRIVDQSQYLQLQFGDSCVLHMGRAPAGV